MLIGKKYKVESDALNVTLYKRGASKKTGKEYFRPIAYFSSCKNALKYLIDLEVAETGLVDLRAVVEKQDELYKLIDGLQKLPQLVTR